MATEKDAQIFVSGVTQYSMSSGKFASSEILEIARNAYAAFCDVFGKPTAEPAYAPSHAPSASQGPQRPNWQAAAQAISGPGAPIPPEPKNLTLWGGDKAFLGWKDKAAFGKPQPEVCWGEWLGAAAEGDQDAKKLLEKAAAADPYKGDPKWHSANIKRIARAKACLKLLAEGYGAMSGGDMATDDPTPFG